MKKKVLSIFFTAVMVCVLLLGGAMGVLAEDISTVEQLLAIDGQSGTYTLTRDLALPANFTSIADFSGTLDGGGHAITNLTGRGLFLNLSGATIRNLNISDCNVTGADGSIGALVGTAIDATITRCGVSGTVTGTGGTMQVGGLVGHANNITMNMCWSVATLRAESTNITMGGLIGMTATGGTVSNSYSTGAVTGNANDTSSMAGGLIGIVDGQATVANCYASGKVASNVAGALVGRMDGPFRNCYFLENGSQRAYGAYPDGATAPTGATAVTEARLKSGEIAYLLQGSMESLIWGQVLTGGNVDVSPVITTTAGEQVLRATVNDSADKALGVEYFNSGAAPSFSSLARTNMTLEIYSDRAMTTAVAENTTYTTDATLYGKYVCVVTFDSNGGSSVASVRVDLGGKLTAPTAPTRSGYTFDTWYKDSAFRTQWDFSNDTVTENTTLYARWNGSGTTATTETTTAASSNPQAGDAGIPTMYYVIAALALAVLCVAGGLLVRAKKKGKSNI